MKLVKSCLLIVFLLALVACSHIAVLITPKKQAIPSHTAQAKTAETAFWTTLHEGRYQQIPQVTEALTAAYLDNPNDPKLAAHLGFLHIWQLTERERLTILPATITNQVILSKKFFSDAVELNPHDARFLGFLGDATLAEGKVFQDEREQVRGYFTLKEAIKEWPEFNYFTAGYIMSILPSDSKQFKEGLEWQWKTLDLCAMTTVDREHPSFKPYLSLETPLPPKSACWNSWIAPYNFEGFFLNMGDMLVKSGDWKTAIKIYKNAKLAKNYSAWPYRQLLENHLTHAKENVKHFNAQKINFAHEKPIAEYFRMNHTILFNSGFGCVACHQSKK